MTGSGFSRFLHLPQQDGDPIQIHVVEHLADRKERAVALVLPFTAGHARNLRPVCEELAGSGVHAIAVDYPGHGRSGGERGAINIEELFETIDITIDEYSSRFPDLPLLLVGSSWGGDLAILYALWEQENFTRQGRFPRVASVVAQAAITPWQRDVFCKFRRGISLFFAGNGVFRDMLRFAIGPRLPVSTMYRLKDMYHEAQQRKRFAADPLMLRSYETSDYFAYLDYQPAPVTEGLRTSLHLVIGDRDAIVTPAYEQLVYQGLRERNFDVELTTLANAGHGIFEEEPNKMCQAILDAIGNAQPTREIRVRLDSPVATHS